MFLEGLPRLDASRRNEAARFVTLIDALYEAGAKLVVLAEAEHDDLYPAGDGTRLRDSNARLHGCKRCARRRGWKKVKA